MFALNDPINIPPNRVGEEEEKFPESYSDQLREVEQDMIDFEMEMDQEKQFKCLIANDEAMQLEILAMMFRMAGMEVTTAINGHQAFEFLSKSRDFDLVVLDLHMPISDGYETCSNIVKLFK